MPSYFDAAGKFLHGDQDFLASAGCALNCLAFEHDNDEEEEVSDCARSCYNCLYRRWTADSFTCMKPIGRMRPIGHMQPRMQPTGRKTSPYT